MAGKGLIPFPSSSGSTFDLVGVPTPANQVVPVGEMALEEAMAVFVEPLASLPSEHQNGKQNGATKGSPDPQGRPTRAQGFSAPRSAARSLSPRRRGKARAASPYQRPTTGTLGPKGPVNARMTRGNDIPGPSLKPGERHVETLKTKAGDVVYHKYSQDSSSYSPESPPPRRFQICGVRTPTGFGKALKPALTPKEKGLAESTESSPASNKVRRHLSPPPIKNPAGCFNSSGEKSPKGPTVAQLSAMIVDLRLENRRLNDKVAEGRLEMAELKDEFDTLRRGLRSKMRRLYKAVEKEELYDCPSP